MLNGFSKRTPLALALILLSAAALTCRAVPVIAATASETAGKNNGASASPTTAKPASSSNAGVI